MTPIILLALILIGFVAYQMAAIVLNLREIRRLHEIECRQLTQHKFGKLRHKLMLAAAEGRISSKSFVFLHLYGLNTAIMRNPDKYSQIAEMLREDFVNPSVNNQSAVVRALMAEKDSWPVAMKELLRKEADAILMLMLEHSPLIKTVFLLARLMRKVVVKTFQRELGFALRSARFLAQVQPNNAAFMSAQDELRALAT